MTTNPWWRSALTYQVYPRSFSDANGDGTGDINGIRSKLAYLADLGVDAIWMSPWYPSPLNDGGYDVTDYRAIDPRFGSLADAEALLREAAQHGIRIIIDLVPNHTASDHAWFKAAVAAGPGSAERDRYIFRPGSGVDGSQPPNNWTAVFGGSTWERVNDDPADGEWYLHLFDPTQPDLNWNNEEVRAEFDDIFRFWLERGVDGFRIDVAHGMIKDLDFPDLETETELLGSSDQPNHPHWDRDGVHEINRRWRAILDEHQERTGATVMMVAEAWVSPESLPLYLRPDEYHQSFNFDFLSAPWDRDTVQTIIDRAITAAKRVGSTPTWTLSNHDVMRHATRFGLPNGTNWRTWPLTGPHDVLDEQLGLTRARAATMLLMALPGSVYIYQGEEMGLPEVWDLPPEVLDDPVWENSNHEQKGRDGCRVPIPWQATGPSFGFGASDPWLPQPAVYGELAAESQVGDPNSTHGMYRQAIAIRRVEFANDEEFIWRPDLASDSVIAFERGSGVLCLVNYSSEPVELPDGEVLLASAQMPAGTLASNGCIWLRPT